MSTQVIIAVLIAAVLHASWNAMAKGGKDTTLSMAAVIIGHTPFALIALCFVPLPTVESLPYLAGGMVLHFGYQVFLINSYKIGDLTQVYPIARGIAPLIVASVSVLFLNVQLGWAETIAVLLIGIGILSLGLVRSHGGGRNHKAAALAVVTGCFIAAYSLVVWGFTQAPIALVTALRETSIIFALFIGVFFMKERLDLAKVLSTFMTLTGAILLRFAKS